MSPPEKTSPNTLPTHFSITINEENRRRRFDSKVQRWKYPVIIALLVTTISSLILDWHPLASYLGKGIAHSSDGHDLPDEMAYLPVPEVERPGKVIGFKLPLLPPIPVPDPLQTPPEWTTDTPTTKEAYVTFLADIVEPYYYNAIRTQLFQLRYDLLTRDPTRDYVVLTTPHIPPILEQTLRSEGALIIRRPLLTGFKGQVDPHSTHQWKDQFSKLHVLNLTQYERILYLDSDQILNKPLSGIWEDRNAWPEFGLAGCADVGFEHETPARDGDRFNGGFWIAKPDEGLLERLIELGRSDEWSEHWDMEQALLNHYFRRDGPTPWVTLDHARVAGYPNARDIEYGITSLHEKAWQGVKGWREDVPREMTMLWRNKVGRMEGWWLAMESKGDFPGGKIWTEV